jgi:hypothetical protein
MSDSTNQLLEENSYCLFQTPWWLDATAPGVWDEVQVHKGGTIFGRFPYVRKRSLGKTYYTQPRLTKMLGPWIRPFQGKIAQKANYEKSILNELIDQLPPFTYLHQDLHYQLENWQPFFWKGYKQTTYYTFVIDDLSDPDRVLANFRSEKRGDIRKSQDVVEVLQDQPADEFYRQYQRNLLKQGKKISYGFELFQRIYNASYERKLGKVFYARDHQGNVHASLFVVWDSRSAFYLINSIDPEHRSSGATSLLTWSALQYLSDKTERFDFEGSMIENVANSYRAFGAFPKPYSHVWKCNSKPVEAWLALKSLVRK